MSEKDKPELTKEQKDLVEKYIAENKPLPELMMKESADKIEKKLSDKELRKKLYSEMISVEFSVADILLLHVVAMKLMSERKELME